METDMTGDTVDFPSSTMEEPTETSISSPSIRSPAQADTSCGGDDKENTLVLMPASPSQPLHTKPLPPQPQPQPQLQPQPQPQPKRQSTLYMPTKSSLTKQRHGASVDVDLKWTLSGSQKLKSTASSSVGVPRTPRGLSKSQKLQQAGATMRGLTVPVTPKFLTDARMRMAHKERPLTTEERELQAVDEARKAEQQRMLKIKRVFHRVQVRLPLLKRSPGCLSTLLPHTNNVQVKVQHGGTHAVVKSKKELTVPVTPVSYLNRRKGQKLCSLAAAAGSSLGRGSSGGADLKALSSTADFANRRPTQPEPFTFATDARLKGPPTAGTADATPTVAEAAERFMRDARSHGAPAHVPGRRTEAHPPTLRTDQRAKADYRPKVRRRRRADELCLHCRN